MYSSGQGVTENLTEAYFWLSLAARNGESGAEGTRSVIERRMTRDQITEAQRRSAAWKPKSSQ
jgi:TPR repeat protein